MSDIKLIRMHSGEDVVATITNETDTTITVEDAIVAIPTGQGQLGFAPWIPILSKTEKEVTIDKKFVIFIAEADESVVQQYGNMFGKVIAPSQKIVV